MPIQVTPMSPATASRETLVDHYEVIIAGTAHDLPDRPIPSFDVVSARTFEQDSDLFVRWFWHARDGDRLVGVLEVIFDELEGCTDLAFVEARVHPDERRRGVATALLRAALPTIRDKARGSVVSPYVSAAGPGAAAGRALGFTVDRSQVLHLLTVATVDRSRWGVALPDGYRIVEWIDRAPEEHLASFAALRPLDAVVPNEWMNIEWTADRVRRIEEDYLAHGVEERVVAAVDSRTGRLAAFSSVFFLASRPGYAQNHDGAVHPDHRGRGLGTAVHAELLRRFVDSRPAVTEITSLVNASDPAALAIRRRHGFVVQHETVDLSQPTQRLATRLGAEPGAAGPVSR